MKVLIISFFVSLFAVQPPESVVFQTNENGYKCFRIPAIVAAQNRDLLAFAEARRENCGDFGDVEIVMKRSNDNGKTWSGLQVVADYGSMQAGNPAPVFDLTDKKYKNGRFFLFYNTGITTEEKVRKGEAIREISYKTSIDNGKTWSEAINITEFVSKPLKPQLNPKYNFKEDWRSYANTPGHAVQIKAGKYKGRIFIAANHSEGDFRPDSRDYFAHAFYTDDHAKTWKLTKNVNYAGSNESIAAETSDGNLLMNSRNESRDAKYRILSFSTDAGETFDSVRLEESLPDPICQASMIDFQTKDKKHYLIFSNPNSQTKREKMTIRISKDDGKTWSSGKEIDAGSAAYSDLVIQKDKKIGILYEKDNYSKIVYRNFELGELID